MVLVYFPWWLVMLSIFIYLLVTYIYLYLFLLLRNESSHYPIFKLGIHYLLLSCRSSLYILEINLLSNIWFADIFSHSLSCLFTLLIASFVVQSFLVRCSSTCLILLLLSVVSVLYSWNYWQDQCHEAFPHVFFLEFYNFRSYD